MSIKVVSWNVNGVRAVNRKGTLDQLILDQSPDILCLQEIKCNDETASAELVVKFKEQYPYVFYNTSKTKKGYSGVAVLAKMQPKNVTYDLHNHAENDEGRVITFHLDSFVLVNVYTPNSGQDLKRLEYRTTKWDRCFEAYIKELSAKKQTVVVVGDLNVAHQPIDIYNPKHTNYAGYTPQERASFDVILTRCKLVDTFRTLHPTTVKYSYWSNLGRSKDPNNPNMYLTPRQANKGWRIDYVLVSAQASNKVHHADILTEHTGSDHAPVVASMTM